MKRKNELMLALAILPNAFALASLIAKLLGKAEKTGRTLWQIGKYVGVPLSLVGAFIAMFDQKNCGPRTPHVPALWITLTSLIMYMGGSNSKTEPKEQ